MSLLLRVLLVEDSKVDALCLLGELDGYGYDTVYERVETAEGLRVALACKEWDVVVANYTLPEFSAPEALKIVQESGLDLPFIVLSKRIEEEVAVKMMQDGARDYVFKDNLKRLVPAIARELREAELRRQKRRAETAQSQLATVIEASESAIIFTNLEGQVMVWNPGAEKLYGYSEVEAKGQPLANLLQPATSKIMPAFKVLQLLKTIHYHQAIHQCKNGRLLNVSLTISLIEDELGQAIGISMIAKHHQQHPVFDQMKDELLSTISHELRTPIACLQGSIELLLTGKLGELSDRGQRMLQIAATNTDRLVHLTNEMLDLEDAVLNAVVTEPCEVEQIEASVR